MNVKNRLPLYCVGVVWLLLCVILVVSPSQQYSNSERRSLAQFPKMSVSNIMNGSFMEKYEDYSRDQFPFRDQFRSCKAKFHYYILGQKENNGIYKYKDFVGKLEYPLNEDSVSYAAGRFQYIYDRYLKESSGGIYVSVIPDKGYYLPEDCQYPQMDYDAMFRKIEEAMTWANYVDISEDLQLTSYYKTDIHWSQNSLEPVAMRLMNEMGAEWTETFEPSLVSDSFLGVYYGQSALPLPAESMYIMRNETLDHCRVHNHETGTIGQVYDLEKLNGRDQYEVYLSGSVSLLTIENPDNAEGKELILFRDSFGSSLAPWIVPYYSKVTLVDIRYISPQILDRYVDFHGQDVLFLYSVPVLNNSNTLK